MYKWLFIEPFYGREMILYLKQRPDLTLVILQLVVSEETHVSKPLVNFINNMQRQHTPKLLAFVCSAPI